MKNIIIIFVFIFTANLTFGQSMFDKLEDIDEVSSVVVNKDAFEMLSKFNVGSGDNEAIEVFNMIKDLKELKVFTTEDSAISSQMEGMVKSSVTKNNLIELMRVKDKGSRVKIYVKSTKNKDFVSEVLMFVKDKSSKKGGAESVIVSLTGTIDINKMSKLAETFSKDKNVKVKGKFTTVEGEYKVKINKGNAYVSPPINRMKKIGIMSLAVRGNLYVEKTSTKTSKNY